MTGFGLLFGFKKSSPCFLDKNSAGIIPKLSSLETMRMGTTCPIRQAPMERKKEKWCPMFLEKERERENSRSSREREKGDRQMGQAAPIHIISKLIVWGHKS